MGVEIYVRSYFVMAYVMVLVMRFLFLVLVVAVVFFFQAEDGIRDVVRSRGLGDVYEGQPRVPRQRTREREGGPYS